MEYIQYYVVLRFVVLLTLLVVAVLGIIVTKIQINRIISETQVTK